MPTRLSAPWLDASTPSLNAAMRERLSDKIRIDGECWLWTAFCGPDGYGRFNACGEMYAHRVLYILMHGSIPAGMELDHLCKNRGCVNPAHLDPVNHRENLMRGDGWGAKNARKTACHRGHPFDEKNTGRIKDGRRYCRSCLRASSQRQRDKRKEAICQQM